jgi:hypothetical protein
MCTIFRILDFTFVKTVFRWGEWKTVNYRDVGSNCWRSMSVVTDNSKNVLEIWLTNCCIIWFFQAMEEWGSKPQHCCCCSSWCCFFCCSFCCCLNFIALFNDWCFFRIPTNRHWCFKIIQTCVFIIIKLFYFMSCFRCINPIILFGYCKTTCIIKSKRSYIIQLGRWVDKEWVIITKSCSCTCNRRRFKTKSQLTWWTIFRSNMKNSLSCDWVY